MNSYCTINATSSVCTNHDASTFFYPIYPEYLLYIAKTGRVQFSRKHKDDTDCCWKCLCIEISTIDVCTNATTDGHGDPWYSDVILLGCTVIWFTLGDIQKQVTFGERPVMYALAIWKEWLLLCRS